MKKVIPSLVLVALVSVICSNSYAQRTITGRVLYNGAPITNYTNKPVTFWARNEDSPYQPFIFPTPPQYNTTDGTYSIPNMPPSSNGYGIQVYIDDAPPFDGQYFPGDYWGWNDNIIVPAGEGIVNQDLAINKLIHLTSPVDNLSKIGYLDVYPNYYQNTMLFKWEAIAEASVYQISIDKYQSPPNYQYLGNVFNGPVQGTEITIQLDNSLKDQHYQFSIYAKKSNDLPVGQLIVVANNGYGWDYRFRIGAANAVNVTLNFSGVRLYVVGEYINAVPVAQQQFAPLFQNGKTVTVSISYDASQPDTDPDPNTGTYKIGSLSVQIPEIGLSASRSSNNMQISAFNNTSSNNDQFFAYSNGVDSFSSSVGLQNPTDFEAEFFGNTSMLGNDLLPTSPLNWTSGSVSFFFTDTGGNWRQVLLSFSPVSATCPTPGTPSNPFPSDTATEIPLKNQTLSWASNGDSYDVYFGTSNIPPNPLFVGNVIGTSFSLPALNPNTTYYWKMVAKNNCGNSTSGPLWSFATVAAIPAPPILVSPGNGETGVGLSPTLVWNAPPGAIISYDLQLSADPSFATTIVDGSGLTTTSYLVSSPLSNETSYYWRVRATNSQGTGAWSDVWTFITQPPYGNLFIGVRGVTDPDTDADGIDDAWETANLSTLSPNYKTLFVRPKKLKENPDGTPIIPPQYEYWPGFIALFPDSRTGRYGFADIPPLTNTGIEVVVIGPTCCTDPTNPATCTYISGTTKCHNYAQFDNFNYDPGTDPNHPNCDILEVIYMNSIAYCAYGSQNYGHTFFSATGPAWSWDTKGYTPSTAGPYGYKTPLIYPFPLANYFQEGDYSSIQAGQTPVVSTCSSSTPCKFTSPLNVNATNAPSGLPDATVEFNPITFTSAGVISSITPPLPTTGYDKNTVLRRTIVHELIHALLAGLDSDHCADPHCIMYGSMVNWELQNVGPGDCVHKPGGSKDIRAAGIIHNSVHGIVATPAAPTLASPVNGATGVATNPTLSWTASTGATSYRLQVSASNTFETTATVVDQSSITGTSYALPAGRLSNSMPYYWRVNATNAGGTSAWSAVWGFTTVVALPPAPTLISPANQTSPTVARPITFKWNPSTGATSYQLQVSTSRTTWSGSSLKLNQSNITTTSYTESVLARNTTYYWRVRASNTGGTSAYSSVWTFRTSP
jgi:hypothetical protein